MAGYVELQAKIRELTRMSLEDISEIVCDLENERDGLLDEVTDLRKQVEDQEA